MNNYKSAEIFNIWLSAMFALGGISGDPASPTVISGILALSIISIWVFSFFSKLKWLMIVFIIITGLIYTYSFFNFENVFGLVFSFISIFFLYFIVYHLLKDIRVHKNF